MDPPRADIRTGYMCNNNCKFCCVASYNKVNMSTEEIKKEIDFAKKNGSEKIVFTGGEPTIRKDIFELVNYASNKKFKDILIITNARMCSQDGFFDKLIKSGLTSICFSVIDYRENEFDYITQVKGSFKQLIIAINLMTQYPKIQFSTITTITKKNYNFLPKIINFLISINKKIPKMYSELMFINPTDNAWTYKNELVPKISEVTPYVKESLKIAKENNLILNVEGIPLCYMKGYENNVVELHMAKERIMFDPNKKPDFNYNINRKNNGKIKSEKCVDCTYNNICEGVWNNYAKIYGVSELKPINPK